jgi:hypothetical protein
MICTSFNILVAGAQLSAEAAGPLPGLKNTAQGIFFAFNMGVSGVFGSLVSGMILKLTQDIIRGE